MNGLLEDCLIRFRNFYDKNKSLSKMLGLLDYWMNRLKSAQKRTLLELIGSLDYWMNSKVILLHKLT